MRLADLRRLSIRKQFRIRFQLRNGMECVITSRGVAEVPGLKGPADFNLEEELAAATSFVLEPVVADRKAAPPPPRPVSAAELAAMATASSSPGPAHDHEDE